MCESYATLKRPKIGRDSASGVTQDPFNIIISNVTCSCQQAGAFIKLLYDQRNQAVPTSVYFAQDIGCQANDQLVITDRTGIAYEYNVTGPAKPVGRFQYYGMLFEVTAEFIGSPT